MKNFMKVAAIAALAFVSTNAMAQYSPEAGDISTEVKFNPFKSTGSTFSLEGLKFRYFLTNQDAIRLNVNFGINNNTTTDKGVKNDKFDGQTSSDVYTSETETKSNTTTFKIGLGYERHFFQEGRIDLYAGAELGYDGTFYSGEQNYTMNRTTSNTVGTTTTTTTTTTTHNVKYEKMLPGGGLPGDPTTGAAPTAGGTTNQNSFYGAVFTGIDFYIYKGLYVGTELGIKFTTGTNPVNGTWTQDYARTTVNTSGTTSTTTTRNWTYNSETGVCTGKQTVTGAADTNLNYAYGATDYSTSRTTLGIYIEPAFRLGWKF